MKIELVLGAVWGSMPLAQSERSPHFWKTSTIGGLGYAMSWISWQWIAQESTAQAVGRMTAIAALFLGFELCFRRGLLVHLFVTAAGTSLTFLTLLQFKLWKMDALYPLFSPTATASAQSNSAVILACLLFFGGLGAAACFWSNLSQGVVPVLARLMSKRSE